MTYASSASFRRALEDRLRSQSLQTGVSLARLRKMIVFDRLLVRLVHDQPDAWVLKGGLALQLRLGFWPLPAFRPRLFPVIPSANKSPKKYMPTPALDPPARAAG
jgi:hypothetical protein